MTENDPHDEDADLPPESPKSDPIPDEHMPSEPNDGDGEPAAATEAE